MRCEAKATRGLRGRRLTCARVSSCGSAKEWSLPICTFRTDQIWSQSQQPLGEIGLPRTGHLPQHERSNSPSYTPYHGTAHYVADSTPSARAQPAPPWHGGCLMIMC